MTRTAIATCATAVALAAVFTAYPQTSAHADSCTGATSNSPLPLDSAPCADVLAQERRWLTAITEGDRGTVESILAPSFKHTNSDGQLLDRAQEIAGIEKVSFTMNPSDQLVDISGDTAIVHGINTVIDGGQVVARERFTDVFVLQGGDWMAVSAQETTFE